MHYAILEAFKNSILTDILFSSNFEELLQNEGPSFPKFGLQDSLIAYRVRWLTILVYSLKA